MTDKLYTKEDIKKMLMESDHAVYRGLLAIWEKQTIDEQDDNHTRHHNGVGFSGVDAPICSSFVAFYKKAGFLTKPQLKIARKKILKYAEQLKKIANGEDLAQEVISKL